MKAEARTIDDLITQLRPLICTSERLGLGLTKLLLSMARLDLQMQRHAIGSSELDKLCALVERGVARNSSAHSPRSAGRQGKPPPRTSEPNEARDAREPATGNGLRSARAAAALSGRPIKGSFGRRRTGPRKARRR
jgi:hypothetical protein